jgi:thiol-disulfide isomerase/thioredoxin
MKRRLALLLALMLLALCTGCGGKTDDSNSDSQTLAQNTENTGQPENDTSSDENNGDGEERVSAFPDLHIFAAETADGAAFTQDDLAGYDLTIINLWATFCGPCINEMPELAALEKALPDNVRLITLCLDAGTQADEMRSILDGSGFTGVTLVASDGDLAEVMAQTMYVPTTVFVDGQGNMVLQELIGSPENVEETYRAMINDALTRLGKEALA